MTSPYGELVTDDMYAALRQYAYRGLQTPVTIKRRSVSDNPYGDSEESWVVVGTTWGWLRQINKPAILEQLGLAAVTGVYRLELPFETDVKSGDRVELEGVDYLVEDTGAEDTVQVFQEAYVRVVA
jgi:head-tail adaptor